MAERPAETTGEFRVVAPSTKTTRAILVVLAFTSCIGGLLTLLTVANGVRTPSASRAVAISATIFAIGSLFFVGMGLWSANVRLLIGKGRVGYRDIFRRSRLWSQGEIAHVVNMAVSYGRTSQPQRGIYLFSTDGRRLLALNSRAWSAGDLKDLVDATGVGLDFRDGVVTAKEARREFPNAFGWGAEHVMTTTILTMAAAVVLVIVGYTFVSTLFHP